MNEGMEISVNQYLVALKQGVVLNVKQAVLHSWIQILMNEQRNEDAVAIGKSAVARFPKNLKCHIALLEALLDCKYYEDAVLHCNTHQQSLFNEPNFIPVSYLRHKAQVELGLHTDANLTLRSLLREKITNLGLTRVRVYFESYVKDNKIEMVLPFLKEALILFPNEPLLWEVFSYCLCDAKWDNDLFAWLQTFVQKNEDNSDAWEELANLAEDKKSYATAAKAYEKAFELSPEETQFCEKWLYCLIQSGAYKAAESKISALKDILDEDVFYYCCLAQLKLAQHDNKTAYATAKEGLCLYPDHPELTYLKGCALLKMQRSYDALSVLSDAADFFEDAQYEDFFESSHIIAPEDYHLAKGKALIANGYFESAAELLYDLTIDAPEMAQIWAYYAYAKHLLNDLDLEEILEEAREHCNATHFSLLLEKLMAHNNLN